MNCAESETLLHALIDGELDAGHARDVEAHVATCPACADKLSAFRTMREAIAAANLKEAAPASLRSRLEAALPPHRGARRRRAPILVLLALGFALILALIFRRVGDRHGAFGSRGGKPGHCRHP